MHIIRDILRVTVNNRGIDKYTDWKRVDKLDTLIIKYLFKIINLYFIESLEIKWISLKWQNCLNVFIIKF